MVDLITKRAIKWLMCGQHIQYGYPEQKDNSCPTQNCTTFQTTQNSKQFKTYKALISGIFHFIFSDHNWQKTKPQISRTFVPRRHWVAPLDQEFLEVKECFPNICASLPALRGRLYTWEECTGCLRAGKSIISWKSNTGRRLWTQPQGCSSLGCV
jgi:hypothetical protein